MITSTSLAHTRTLTLAVSYADEKEKLEICAYIFLSLSLTRRAFDKVLLNGQASETSESMEERQRERKSNKYAKVVAQRGREQLCANRT